MQITAEAEGGRVEADAKGLRIVDADSVTLRLSAATSFKGRDPEAACTEALRLFPSVNGQIDGEEVVLHDYADIGIAVSSPKGLMVPVLPHAEARD